MVTAAAAAAMVAAPAAGADISMAQLQVDPRALPTIETLASPSISLGGGQLFDVAVVSGRINPQPGATVSFALFGPDDATCAGPPLFQSLNVPYPVEGGAVSSASFVPAAAGTYRWRASYSGDANNQPVAAPCNAANENVLVHPPALTPSSELALLSPFPIVRVVGRTTPRGVRITLMTVRAESGSFIVTSCSGRSCPYRRRISQVPGAAGRTRTVQIRGLTRPFRSGVILRVYVVKPGRIGKFTSFKIQRRRSPIRTDRCVRGTVLVPVRCPAT